MKKTLNGTYKNLIRNDSCRKIAASSENTWEPLKGSNTDEALDRLKSTRLLPRFPKSKIIPIWRI